MFGEAFWPGASSFVDCNYTCSLGITPGTATMTIPPQLSQVAEIGDLRITDGQNTLTLRDCKVVRPSGQVGGQGQQVILLIEDRRWRWQFGTISGRYNILDERTSTIPPAAQPGAPPANPLNPPEAAPHGEEPIKAWSRKTAPELAELCLKAMGELRYDISALDPTATPTINWDAIKPAQALESLANDLGCVVVYRPDTDSVLIAKHGDGQELPDGPFLSDAPSLTVKARPSKIVCFGAPTRYQLRFPLIPVGIDFDGSVKTLGHLSYRPDGGWTKVSPPSFNGLLNLTNLPGGRKATDAIGLAQQSVYRMYRVDWVNLFDEVPLGPGAGKIILKRLSQIRLLPFRNVATKDDLGRDSIAAAVCYGRHSPRAAIKIGEVFVTAYNQTDVNTEVKVPFSIDERRQLIVFSEYVFALHDDTTNPAEIVLECAAEIADPNANHYVRYQRELPLGSAGLQTKPACFVAEDVIYKVTATYDDDGEFVKNETNASTAERRADYYIRGELRRYEPSAAGDRAYPGILPIYPDGAIMQVTWSVGGGSISNPSTRASRNSEHALYLPTYRGRRRNELTDLDSLRRAKEEAEAAKIRNQEPVGDTV